MHVNKQNVVILLFFLSGQTPVDIDVIEVGQFDVHARVEEECSYFVVFP